MKLFLPLLLVLLTGCAPTVLYKSEPPGAIISGNTPSGRFSYNTPIDLTYPTLANDFKEGFCTNILTPIATWPDGVMIPSKDVCLIHRKSEYTFVKPAQVYQTPAYQPPSSPVVGMDDAKKKCAELGFKSGTETFGNCVLKLSK